MEGALVSREDKVLTVSIVNSNVRVKLYPGDRVRLVRAVGPDQADITLGDLRAKGNLRTDGQVLLDNSGQTWLIMNGHWQILDVLERAKAPLPTAKNAVICWYLSDDVIDTAQLLDDRWYVIGESESLSAKDLVERIGKFPWWPMVKAAD